MRFAWWYDHDHITSNYFILVFYSPCNCMRLDRGYWLHERVKWEIATRENQCRPRRSRAKSTENWFVILVEEPWLFLECPLGTHGVACNATCFPGYFGYLCKDECDCPVDQCDRKYSCRRNAPGRSLRKNMGNIFLNTTFFPIKYYFFLNSCDNAKALVRNEY